MLKNTDNKGKLKYTREDQKPRISLKQLRSLLYKRVSKGDVIIGEIFLARGLGFGINFHGRKVFLGGGNVNPWPPESELPISCDLKFIKGTLKVIFFFFNGIWRFRYLGLFYFLHHTVVCLVKNDLIEAVSELVWGHFKHYTGIDLEPMTLCNLAKQRKKVIYWTRSGCPRAAISWIPLVHHWGSMNSIAGFYINTWIWTINPWDDSIRLPSLLTFLQYSCFCVLFGFYNLEFPVPKDSGKQILVKVSRGFGFHRMVWKHFCHLVIIKKISGQLLAPFS